MGKKKVAILGSENEDQLRSKKAVKLEQKKLRTGKEVKKEEEISPTPDIPIPSTPSKPSRRTVHIRSRSYKLAKTQVQPDAYSVTEGLKLLHLVSLTKFDPTVELHITLAEKSAPREVDLPHGTGKVKRIAIATDNVVTQIEKGVINFDILLATPAQMAKLVKLAKILGPKGLMPNPKTGTIVNDPDTLAKSLAAKNSVSLKTEKDAPLIHLTVGRLSLGDAKLSANIQAVLTGLSGLQVKKVVLKSTMSPAIKLSI